ncbi:MAG: dehydrogenase, partial [Nitrospira bacterium SG8_35_1]
VSDEAASFTVLGAIALQGIRLFQPTLGEAIVVTGLGLIGLLTVQLLRAHGCRVLGIDFDETKLELARQFGAETVSLAKGEDPVEAGLAFSRGRGVDGALITASTKSSDPVSQAARMCRKRGRIVLVGVTGLELNRSDFYEKELSFQVSCSYGPGRYDKNYEEKGQDYPFGFVRWTEQRNFEAVLDMMAAGKIETKSLISHRFPLEQAVDAYRVLTEDRSALGILLQYPSVEQVKDERIIQLQKNEYPPFESGEPVVGFIGAGNYATRILIPAFKESGANLYSVASSGGGSGNHAGLKYGFKETTTDTAALISNPQINTIVITTRHNSHGRFICEALKAGKHIFAEKPLCLTFDELSKIKEIYSSLFTSHSSLPILMVGFNRRFAPQIKKMKELLNGVRSPKSFIMTVNAGTIPADHWTQDLQIGGGRIIGEACHFIDLLRFLSGNEIITSSLLQMDTATGDTVNIELGFADGSIGTVHYFANGSKSFSKERLEIFAAGRILQLDNFRTLKGYNWPGFKKMNLWKQDKGQKACAAAFVKAIKTGQAAPIPFDEIIEVSRVTIELVKGKKDL